MRDLLYHLKSVVLPICPTARIVIGVCSLKRHCRRAKTTQLDFVGLLSSYSFYRLAFGAFSISHAGLFIVPRTDVGSAAPEKIQCRWSNNIADQVCTHANRLLSSLMGLEALTRHLSCAQACGRPPESRKFGGVRLSCRPSPLLKGRRVSLHRRPVVGNFVAVVVAAAAAAQTRPSRFRSSLQRHRARPWAPPQQGGWPRVQHLRRHTFNRVSGSRSRGAQICSYRSAKRSSSAASAMVKALWSDEWLFAVNAQWPRARSNKPCCPGRDSLSCAGVVAGCESKGIKKSTAIMLNEGEVVRVWA